MSTLTRLARLAALPLAASLLVACGGNGDDSSASGDASASPDSSSSADAGSDEGSDSDAYCDDLREAQKSFAAFGNASPEPEQLEQAFSTFHTLADEAPAAVEADWKTIDTAVTTVEDSLDEVGLKISDLATLQQGQLPEGVTAQELQGVATQLQSLGDAKFAAAGEAIEKHAKSECDIDLGGTASASPSESPSS